MMRTPDGNGKLELTKFHHPTAIRAEPADTPSNALGLRSIMFEVDDIDAAVAGLHVQAPNSWVRWRSSRTSTAFATSVARRDHRRVRRGSRL